MEGAGILKGECSLISGNSMNYNQRFGVQIWKQEETFLLFHYPKLMRCSSRLKGAKVFSTLDLRSSYYHIGLSAFVTPFGKYQFEAVPFCLAQAPAYFIQLHNVEECSCSSCQ